MQRGERALQRLALLHAQLVQTEWLTRVLTVLAATPSRPAASLTPMPGWSRTTHNSSAGARLALCDGEC